MNKMLRMAQQLDEIGFYKASDYIVNLFARYAQTTEQDAKDSVQKVIDRLQESVRDTKYNEGETDLQDVVKLPNKPQDAFPEFIDLMQEQKFDKERDGRPIINSEGKKVNSTLYVLDLADPEILDAAITVCELAANNVAITQEEKVHKEQAQESLITLNKILNQTRKTPPITYNIGDIGVQLDAGKTLMRKKEALARLLEDANITIPQLQNTTRVLKFLLGKDWGYRLRAVIETQYRSGNTREQSKGHVVLMIDKYLSSIFMMLAQQLRELEGREFNAKPELTKTTLYGIPYQQFLKLLPNNARDLNLLKSKLIPKALELMKDFKMDPATASQFALVALVEGDVGEGRNRMPGMRKDYRLEDMRDLKGHPGKHQFINPDILFENTAQLTKQPLERAYKSKVGEWA